jgi:hypothetical protein
MITLTTAPPHDPVWKTLGVFYPQQECFAALEDNQLAADRVLDVPDLSVSRYYRCDLQGNQ